MKTITLLPWLGTLASLITIDAVLGQAAPVLGLQMYAGLNITGAVGTVYAIQATPNVTQTNDWTCLAFVQLPASNYLWLDKAAPATQSRFYRAVATTPSNLVFIPPGIFRMGSPTTEVGRQADEGPQTEVTLTKGFYIGKYPVTQAEYVAVEGTNPSAFSGVAARPVDSVSWNDATNYCARRTQKETALGLIPAGSRYRLPTEAEWEYACRALTSTRFYFGNDEAYTNLTNYAWSISNSGNTTHPVGEKLPNAWGLYDMAGNVLEWCQDWYGLYTGGRVTDPQGPVTGANRVFRVDSWHGTPPEYCRSAQRFQGSATLRANGVGLRVVLACGQ